MVELVSAAQVIRQDLGGYLALQLVIGHEEHSLAQLLPHQNAQHFDEAFEPEGRRHNEQLVQARWVRALFIVKQSRLYDIWHAEQIATACEKIFSGIPERE